MPRNRSRSPQTSKRDRRASRSRSRERRHRKKRSRSRSPRHRGSSPRHRSRSPHSPRRRQTQRSPSPSKHRERDDSIEKGVQEMAVQQIDESKLEGLDDEQVDMMKLMGFAGFNTTKGKKVSGNDVSAVNLQRKRRYRQYMNRRGGFNRPLDFVA